MFSLIFIFINVDILLPVIVRFLLSYGLLHFALQPQAQHE
jgi:hypothetical protein